MRVKMRLMISFLLLVILTGCWDLEEIDQRMLVTALGIDLAPGNRLEVTVQVPLPQTMQMNARSSPPTGPGKVFNTLSVTANSVFEGFRKLQAKTNRRLVIQENRLIILSEAVARLGVEPVLAWYARSPKAPPQALVMIVHRFTAKELLSLEPAIKRLPGQELMISSESAYKYDRTYYLPFWGFRQKILDKAKDTYAPLLDYNQEEKQYFREGLAVFDGDRLSGELTADEAQIFGLISHEMKSGGMTFELPPERFGPGHRASLRNIHGNTKIRVLIKNGRPLYIVTTNIKGTLSELIGEQNQFSIRYSRELQSAIQEIIRRREVLFIKKLQQLNSDIINFGEQTRVQHLRWWRKTEWKKVFPSVPYKVIVKVHIVREGVLR